MDIKPGDFFEDCACHPCLCVAVDDAHISGYSLVDGHKVFCGMETCGIVKLSFEQAIQWREHGPSQGRDLFPPEQRWWKE